MFFFRYFSSQSNSSELKFFTTYLRAKTSEVSLTKLFYFRRIIVLNMSRVECLNSRRSL